MSAPSIKAMQRRLQTLANRQEKIRDAIRAFESEVNDYAEHADEAFGLLNEAIDKLSEIV